MHACDRCGYAVPMYNSCRNRHCPTCQSLEQHKWLERRRDTILPAPYFHVVFTLPAELRPVVAMNRERLFGLLFEAASKTLLLLSRDKKRLGGMPAITMVLHTWTRELVFHPHVHAIVSAGALSEDDAEENVFLSQLSVSMALGMTLNGASGETYEAMKKTLELHGLSEREINESYQSLIELLETEERWSEAIDQYIELADTFNQLGSFEQSRDTFAIAERLARRVAAPSETIVRIKHRMADIDQMRLDTRRAQKSYEEILQLAADDERAHRMLVDLNYRQGNHIEGLRRLDQLLGIYARTRQVNKITQLLEELVTLYGSDTGLRFRLAQIYRQLGRKADAIIHLDALGELQLEAGMHREAANTIRQIISLNPDGVEEYRRLLAQLGG